MCEVTELNYSQLKERLKFLSVKYPEYKLCVNCTSKYKPKDVLCRSLFSFDDDNKNLLCYKHKLDYECCSTVYARNEAMNLAFISDEALNQKVIIVGDDSKTFYVCGVYVDNKNKALVLLNGYYKGKELNWSKLSDNIY